MYWVVFMDDDAAGALSNEPIDVAGLPRLGDDAYTPVDARHVIGTVAGFTIAAVAVVVGGVVVDARTDGPALLAVAIALAGVLVLSALTSLLAARRISYQVREHDLSLRSGLLTRTEATVPFRRVQHVHLSRGVLERSLGLASLSINSAGPDISVPGLPVDTATVLRSWIVERADLDAEHTTAPGGAVADRNASGRTDPGPGGRGAVADDPPWAPPTP